MNLNAEEKAAMEKIFRAENDDERRKAIRELMEASKKKNENTENDNERWTISSNLDRNRYIKSLKDAKELLERRAEVFCYYEDEDFLRLIETLDKEIQQQKGKLKNLY